MHMAGCGPGSDGRGREQGGSSLGLHRPSWHAGHDGAAMRWELGPCGDAGSWEVPLAQLAAGAGAGQLQLACGAGVLPAACMSTLMEAEACRGWHRAELRLLLRHHPARCCSPAGKQGLSGCACARTGGGPSRQVKVTGQAGVLRGQAELQLRLRLWLDQRRLRCPCVVTLQPGPGEEC